MEPWTYGIGLVALIGSYSYFAFTRRELSPKAIYEHMVETKKLKNYADANFDLAKYKTLAGHAQELRDSRSDILTRRARASD